MKISFFIRNGWYRHHSGAFYWFGLGYDYQGWDLLCYHFWIAGFCFCLFVDGQGKKQPRPVSKIIKDYFIKRRHNK